MLAGLGLQVPHSAGVQTTGPHAHLGPQPQVSTLCWVPWWRQQVPALGSGRPPFIRCPALRRVCGFVNCWVSGISLRREVSPSREQLMRREKSRLGEGSEHVRAVGRSHLQGPGSLPSDPSKPQLTWTAAPGKQPLSETVIYKTPCLLPLPPVRRDRLRAFPAAGKGFMLL